MRVTNLEELNEARVYFTDLAEGTEVAEPRDQMEVGRFVLVLLQMLEGMSLPDERDADVGGTCMMDEERQNETLNLEWEYAEVQVDNLLEYPYDA